MWLFKSFWTVFFSHISMIFDCINAVVFQGLPCWRSPCWCLQEWAFSRKLCTRSMANTPRRLCFTMWVPNRTIWSCILVCNILSYMSMWGWMGFFCLFSALSAFTGIPPAVNRHLQTRRALQPELWVWFWRD